MIRLPLLALPVVLGLLGCGLPQGVHRDTFKPYVSDVVQGNFVSREQREVLQPGMTREQVRDILGTPLITSLFHAHRWDYTFSIRRQGVAPQQFRLTVHFNGDQLSRTEGDELPSEAEFAQRLSVPSATPKAPVSLQATPQQLQKYPTTPRPPPASVASSPLPLPAQYPPLESAPR